MGITWLNPPFNGGFFGLFLNKVDLSGEPLHPRSAAAQRS